MAKKPDPKKTTQLPGDLIENTIRNDWYLGALQLWSERIKGTVFSLLEFLAFGIMLVAIIYYSVAVLIFSKGITDVVDFIELANKNWIAFLIIISVILYRPITNKLQQLKKFKDAEF